MKHYEIILYFIDPLRESVVGQLRWMAAAAGDEPLNPRFIDDSFCDVTTMTKH